MKVCLTLLNFVSHITNIIFILSSSSESRLKPDDLPAVSDDLNALPAHLSLLNVYRVQL